MTNLGYKKMRKCFLLMLLGVLFFFTSCMDTYYVTKKSTFDTAIRSVQSQMAAQGFSSTGSNTNTRNETVVTGVSYSKYTGYGSAMANNFITQDTYRFADSLGNTMNYSVSYQAKQSKDGIPYVENVELCGCETSNPKDYERLCGNESYVKSINNMPKELKIEEMNVVNTTLAVSGIALGATLLITLITLAAY